MATNPLPGSTFTFSIPLDDLANAGLFKAAPTIAAGDFKRSINNGALTNMDNLPAVTPAGGKLVQFVLSADETAAAGDGGTIDIVGSDASGAEWGDVTVHVRVGTASANVTMWAGAAVGAAPATVADLPASAIGSGAVLTTVIVNDENDNPLDGVECWISTDEPGTNVVAGMLSTDALGKVIFMLDAGGYYLWRQHATVNFTNPMAITVTA